MNSIKTFLCNLAQCLLIFLIFPIFALICEAFAPASTLSNIITFLGQVPLCETIGDILSQYSSGISSSDLTQITIWVFLKEFPTAIILSISIHFFISIFEAMWSATRLKYKDYKNFKPLPILPAFLGLFVSTVIINLIGLTGNDMFVFFIEIGAIVIMFFGLKMIMSAMKIKKPFSLKKCLIWIIEAIYAVIVSTYVAGLMIITKGTIYSLGAAIGLVVMLASFTCIASVLVFFIRLENK